MDAALDAYYCDPGAEQMPPNNLYPITELLTWLETAYIRWGTTGESVTVRLDGSSLAVYRNDQYRARIPLADRPTLTDWADDDA